MKPKLIRIEEIKSTDSLVSKKVRIETPIGNIESDSGNHLVDVSTVVLVMMVFFLMKKFFQSA